MSSVAARSVTSGSSLSSDISSVINDIQKDNQDSISQIKSEAKAAGLDDAEIKKLEFQQKLEKQKALVEFISNIMKTLHEMMMSVIRNMKLG